MLEKSGLGVWRLKFLGEKFHLLSKVLFIKYLQVNIYTGGMFQIEARVCDT